MIIEKGKWYKSIFHKALYFVSEVDYTKLRPQIVYGFDSNGGWIHYTEIFLSILYFIEASNEEVEQRLREEADKRGFKVGAKFLGCHGIDKDIQKTIDSIKFIPPRENLDYGLHCGNSWIYFRGQWGEVVEDTYAGCNGILEEVVCNSSKEVTTYYFHNSKKHGANFYEKIGEIQVKNEHHDWQTYIKYKQLGTNLEFAKPKEVFEKEFKIVYV